MATNHFYDETAGHRIVVAAMAEGRPLLRVAMLGAYMELISVVQRNVSASYQAGIPIDHVDTTVSRGDLIVLEPWECDALVDALVKYNLLTPAAIEGRYELVKHPMLAHWETPETIYWRKQQRKDTRDAVINRAVRYRDGDQCRVCHVLVKWGASNTHPEGGTLDHVNPRVAADGNPEALAVACRRCNGIRSNNADANEFAPLQPVPDVPFYTKSTADWLRKAGYSAPDGKPLRPTGQKWLLPSVEIHARPARQVDTAPPTSDPAPSGITRTSEPSVSGPEDDQNTEQGQRPRSQRDHAPQGQRPANADNAPSKTRPEFGASSPEVRLPNSGAPPPVPRTKQDDPPPPLPGVGREGKGLDGSGGGQGDRPPPRRRRSRRSKPSQPKENPDV